MMSNYAVNVKFCEINYNFQSFSIKIYFNVILWIILIMNALLDYGSSSSNDSDQEPEDNDR